MSPSDRKTYVCRLTPAGRGAISTILVQGPLAVACVSQRFRPHGSARFSEAKLGRVILGAWAGLATSTDAEKCYEETVVCKIDAEQVEVHCHGGQAAWRMIVDSLEELGCQPIDWQQVQDADRVRRDAVVALTLARTERVAAILSDQWRGALSDALDQLDRALARSELAASGRCLADLLRFRRLGCHLTSPWRVVIAGAPNVGKSSLTNAIVGYERALVYQTPGTTRDVVTAVTIVDGWPVEFSDTAGIRSAVDEIEAAGVEMTIQRLRQCDLVVIVLDASRQPTSDETLLLDRYPDALIVINKVDLVTSPPSPAPACVFTSALTGQGVEELLTQISQRLVVEVPPPNAPVPFTAAQIAELESVQRAVEAGNAPLGRRRLRRFRES